MASKNVTLGIPRIKEILTVTKKIKTPTITLRFVVKFAEMEEMAAYFANTMPATTLNDIASSCEIMLDPDPRSTIIEADEWMVRAATALQPTVECDGKYVIRIVLNRTLMHRRRIAPPDVRRVLKRRLGRRAQIFSSEYNEIDWVVRIRLHGVKEMLAHAHLPDEREAVIAHRIANIILETLVVCGHVGVTAATSRRETVDRLEHKADGYAELRKVTEHVVDVNGGSLIDMTASALIDWSRCYSNDLHDVQATLGISAAAEALLQELHDVISFDGTYIYPGHLLLIVDTMTRDGKLKPLNRFGVNREHSNAFARSSYEETPEVLTEAAVFAENSLAVGVSTNIILGQRAQIGTGITDVRFSASMLPPSLRAGVCKTSRLVKTVVRRANVTSEPRVEHVIQEDVQMTDPIISSTVRIEPPYRMQDDPMGRPTDIFTRDKCMPPFSPCQPCVEEDSTTTAQPFCIHSPRNSS